MNDCVHGGSLEARSARVAALLVAVVGLAACTPGMDWREVGPVDGGWRAMFPCRPGVQSRRLLLGDEAVEWRLHACQADGVTYAVGDADVTDPARVGPALKALRVLAQAQINAGEVPGLPLRWPGMTPQPEAGRWRLEGRTAQGQAVAIELLLASRGTRVVQAMAMATGDGAGASLSSAAVFADGARFQQ